MNKPKTSIWLAAIATLAAAFWISPAVAGNGHGGHYGHHAGHYGHGHDRYRGERRHQPRYRGKHYRGEKHYRGDRYRHRDYRYYRPRNHYYNHGRKHYRYRDRHPAYGFYRGGRHYYSYNGHYGPTYYPNYWIGYRGPRQGYHYYYVSDPDYGYCPSFESHYHGNVFYEW